MTSQSEVDTAIWQSRMNWNGITNDILHFKEV